MGDMIDRDAVLLAIKQQADQWENGVACGFDDVLRLYLPQAIADIPTVTVGVPQMKPVDLARLFHAHYEALAPWHGYETREDTRDFDPASQNGQLMIATCARILAALEPVAAPVTPAMRLETVSENIARDMREGRFPARSEPQMVPVDPVPAPDAEPIIGNDSPLRRHAKAEMPARLTEDQIRQLVEEAPMRRAERVARWQADPHIDALMREQPSPDAAAIREAGLAELVRERDELRSWDDYFRKTCGYKRDGRPSPECLDEFIRGMNDTNRDAALSAAIREAALREALDAMRDAILALITEKPHDRA